MFFFVILWSVFNNNSGSSNNNNNNNNNNKKFAWLWQDSKKITNFSLALHKGQEDEV
jgi:hypothetical protein